MFSTRLLNCNVSLTHHKAYYLSMRPTNSALELWKCSVRMILDLGKQPDGELGAKFNQALNKLYIEARCFENQSIYAGGAEHQDTKQVPNSYCSVLTS